MKKIIRLLLVVSVLLMSVSGCSNTNNSKTEKNIEVVATIFPLYDWCRVLSDGVGKINVTKLVSSSSDMHSYQPSAQDIVKISTCDVFIYVGGESDEWVDNALKQAVNKDMAVINLMDVLENELVLEEEKQGMEAEEKSRYIMILMNFLLICLSAFQAIIVVKDMRCSDTVWDALPS